MRPLSAHTLLRAWEIGRRQHPIDRALTLLSLTCPEKSAAELVSLSVGQRDAQLLTLRELTFGSVLNGMADCPHCREQLEFSLSVSDICFGVPEPLPPQYQLETEGLMLQFRLPNSQDLAAIAACPDLEAANAQLIQRCLLQASSTEGEAISYQDLPTPALAQLTEKMAECDPQADVFLPLTCVACGHSWQGIFDIVTFFWTELNAQAHRLLQEVHLLARFYGWREADILSMSAARRQLYLDMVI
ncbi:MAG: phage baseplate protein [Leptolyngbya sp. SIO4C1]|nr:phage baseplate protein [Leptolyngbya sp. SIO4C1]